MRISILFVLFGFFLAGCCASHLPKNADMLWGEQLRESAQKMPANGANLAQFIVEDFATSPSRLSHTTSDIWQDVSFSSSAEGLSRSAKLCTTQIQECGAGLRFFAASFDCP